MSLLIIGATGALGRQVVKQALNNGYKVRCFTRNLRRANFLKEWGAELIYGDLSLPETIPPALKGISFVIDASTLRPRDDYTSEIIDWKGKLALIEAAKVAKIKKFIFFSIFGVEENSNVALVDLKIKITKRLLAETYFSCTIFQCSGFFQGLIEQYAVPILDKKTIWLVKNSKAIAYLDTQDAAIAIINDLVTINSGPKIFSLIGKKFWTAEEIVALCERLAGQKAKVIYIPSTVLSILGKLLRIFELTWNIADRLQFAEVTNNSTLNAVSEPCWTFERISLETYLQDYFGKILKKLKETNYQQSSNNDISFL